MLQTIQIGRGIAALGVVAFHLSLTFQDDRFLGRPILFEYTWWGERGVDFFFVLSGFIIMFAHERDIGDAGQWQSYAIKRFIRIYPIYWVYTAVICALLALGFGTVKVLPEGAGNWFAVFGLVRINASEPVLPPAWTLYHEIAFYGVFSLLIFSRRIGIAALALWTAANLYNFQYPTGDQMTPVNSYFSPLNLDFLIGIGCFLLWKRASSSICYLAAAIGAALLVVALVSERLHAIPLMIPLLYGLAFGGLLAGAARWEKQSPLKNVPLLSFLGAASYSIYLTHEIFQTVILKQVLKSGFIGPDHPYIAYFVVAISTVALGGMAYLTVEKPLLQILRWAFSAKICRAAFCEQSFRNMSG